MLPVESHTYPSVVRGEGRPSAGRGQVLKEPIPLVLLRGVVARVQPVPPQMQAGAGQHVGEGRLSLVLVPRPGPPRLLLFVAGLGIPQQHQTPHGRPQATECTTQSSTGRATATRLPR